MKKIKNFIAKILKSIEESQMQKAQKILSDVRNGMGRWE